MSPTPRTTCSAQEPRRRQVRQASPRNTISFSTGRTGPASATSSARFYSPQKTQRPQRPQILFCRSHTVCVRPSVAITNVDGETTLSFATKKCVSRGHRMHRKHGRKKILARLAALAVSQTSQLARTLAVSRQRQGRSVAVRLRYSAVAGAGSSAGRARRRRAAHSLSRSR